MLQINAERFHRTSECVCSRARHKTVYNDVLKSWLCLRCGCELGWKKQGVHPKQQELWNIRAGSPAEHGSDLRLCH